MRKKLHYTTGIILTQTFLIASTFASELAREPFADEAVNSSDSQHSTSKSTQEWMERGLRDAGKLKNGQHLKPHQIWRIVDQLERKVENREFFKLIKENEELLIKKGIPKQTITKVLRGVYHSKTSSFEKIEKILRENNIFISKKDLEAVTSTSVTKSTVTN